MSGPCGQGWEPLQVVCSCGVSEEQCSSLQLGEEGGGLVGSVTPASGLSSVAFPAGPHSHQRSSECDFWCHVSYPYCPRTCPPLHPLLVWETTLVALEKDAFSKVSQIPFNRVRLTWASLESHGERFKHTDSQPTGEQ